MVVREVARQNPPQVGFVKHDHVIQTFAAWGRPIAADDVEAALSKCKPKLVAIVHAETSTAVLQPLEEIGKLAHAAGALFLVDAMTM